MTFGQTVLAAGCLLANCLPALGATTQPFQKEIDRESAHLARVEERIKRHPKLATNPYIRLDLAVARRFVERNLHLDFTGKRAWGVEFRAVPYQTGYLVPMMNLLKQAQTVTLGAEGMSDEAVELITRNVISTKNLKLEPMEPVLLRIERR